MTEVRFECRFSAGIGTLDALHRVQQDHTESDDVIAAAAAVTESIVSNSSRLMDVIATNVTNIVSTTQKTDLEAAIQNILNESLNSTHR